MGFKLKQTETFDWPVKWNVPGNGSMVEASFTAVFERRDTDGIKALFGDADAGVSGLGSDEEIVRAIMVGWKQVSDDEGKPAEFSAENLERLLRTVGARGAIVTAYMDAMSGGRLRKNS